MFRMTRVESTRLLAAAGITGVAEFVLAILALHTLGGIPEHMSDFANGPYAWLWAGGAFALALGGICLTLAVRPYLPSGRPAAQVAWSLLWLGCLAAIAVAAFPVDVGPTTTVQGFIHNTAAGGTFTFIALGMLTIAPLLRGKRFHRMGRSSTLIGGTILFLAGCYVVVDVEGWSATALVQRAMAAAAVLWFTVLAMSLMNTARGPSSLETTVIPADDVAATPALATAAGIPSTELKAGEN